MDASLPPELSAAADQAVAAGRRVAIIDIGSNSVRLVIYDDVGRAPTQFYNEKLMCGLGRGIASTGRLPEEGVRRALDALARFRVLCRTANVERVRVLATAAARDAANGPAFLRDAEAACGHPVELLTGEREAALSASGVISGFFAPDGVVGDLGGGSLELVEVGRSGAGAGLTLPLGGLMLQDRAESSPKKALRIVRDELARATRLIDTMAGRTFYAVGGTWRAIAKLDMAERSYPVHVMHGYEFDVARGSFQKMIERAVGATGGFGGVSEGRRPLLVYGAIVLDEIVRLGRPARVIVSALGVREGLLHDDLPESVRALDPLIAASADFNRIRARDPAHAADLVRWTDAFFASLGPEAESADERRLRHAACLLADIGWRAHPDYRGEQSLASIMNSSLLAIDHPGRAYLALAIFFRHDGLSLDGASPALLGVAGPRLVAQARLLASLLRIAYPVSVAMGGVLGRTPLAVEGGGTLVLRLPEEFRPLANERLANRLRQVGKLVGRDSAIRT